MKKLLKIVVALVVLIAVAIVGVHIYFAGGEDATELTQGTPPVQAEASAGAEDIQDDLGRLLEQKDGSLLSAQIMRTLEDAQDSVKNGKTEAGRRYLQEAKDFITTHADEIKSLDGIDTGIVEWFVSTPADSLLNMM